AYAKQYNTISYERLEFLGDSVVKMIISDILFETNMGDPEEMTKIRAVLESNKVLARFAVELGLSDYILSLGEIFPNNLRILADIYEAICGAIYIDSGKELEVVKHSMLENIVLKMDELVQVSNDNYKNLFIEAFQKIYGFTPIIQVDYVESGPDHDKRFGCKGLKILNPSTGELVKDFNISTSHDNFKRKKDADKDLMKRVLEYWKDRDFEL
ncbi:MAG: ribonuclease III family protein, partial [Promethearchaeota archaeon]